MARWGRVPRCYNGFRVLEKVPPSCLTRNIAALCEPKRGTVTCHYACRCGVKVNFNRSECVSNVRNVSNLNFQVSRLSIGKCNI